MIDYTEIGTPIRAIIKDVPGFIRNDVTVSDIYRVAMQDMMVFYIISGNKKGVIPDPIETFDEFEAEILDYCAPLFDDGLWEENDFKVTSLAMSVYTYCRSASAKLRRMEKCGKLALIDMKVKPRGATIH